ncbi:Uncharacterised protein [Chlamydia abortus]|uniref:DUF4825 domain-containing protein n=1 Tax=Paenibacillus residui TaxID=629724 RepID=A0ABW3D4E1_9BACL|nr:MULTISPECIES: hypothetical protein [Paenibacillaceae]SHE11035.1 Uncharacterised protein [Chlamydia abortus]
MKWPAAILSVCLITAAIALFLSTLPQWERFNLMNDNELAVFKENHSTRLSDENLVDKMTMLPLQLNIRRVDWNNSILSIDLGAPAGSTASRVYHDLYELSKFGLQNHTNVDQVLVRVMEASSVSRERNGLLLVSMDARKERVQGQEALKELSGQDVRQYLQSRYRITYTQKWKDVYAY